MQIITIGLDIAKNVFQVHGIHRRRGKGRRAKATPARPVLGFFEELTPCLVGLEACATSHYWARELAKLCHDVGLMPAKDLKACATRMMRLTPKQSVQIGLTQITEQGFRYRSGQATGSFSDEEIPIDGRTADRARSRASKRTARRWLVRLFVTLAQYPARLLIYQVDPLTGDASEGFIGVAFDRNFLRNESLNAIASGRAAVKERRHRRDYMPDETRYLDFDQIGDTVSCAIRLQPRLPNRPRCPWPRGTFVSLRKYP
jgi:hypothetical protein